MQIIEEIKPQQSIELLKSLHILTRDGKINQDSRRKLKQVYHLYNFIEPVLKTINDDDKQFVMVDHGSGKSYLGFILYDLFIKTTLGKVIGIESRGQLVEKSKQLAKKLNFKNMSFISSSIKESQDIVPDSVDMITALHACDTATDDAISFGLSKKAKYMFLVPCCQAEISKYLTKNKTNALKKPLSELWRHGIHTREMGSHLTNVLRCLFLESQGYKVSVTELVGWEHSMKNELIFAEFIGPKKGNALDRIDKILNEFSLQELKFRFSI